MFKNIAVAIDESSESDRALRSAITLAQSLGAELRAISVIKEAPVYTAYARATDPAVARMLENDRLHFYEELQARIREKAAQADLEIICHLVDGNEVAAIVDLLREHKADLLVIGLHHRSLYIARLWSTVYELAQEAPCSVLGVH